MRDKIYFVSDCHLGVPTLKNSQKREKHLIKWLNQVSKDAKEIIILGDLFDFWFEYRTVVPKGFVRLFGKLAELHDQGITISIFAGNHDIWMFDYFEKEIGIKVYHKEEIRTYGNKKLFIAHGDGLGPGDKGFKILKAIFTNKFCQSLFRLFHPDYGIKLALFFSHKSRQGNINDLSYKGDDKEYLYQFIKNYPKEASIDYFIFGHRHLALDKQIDSSRYINLGDWISLFTYAVFDGDKVELKYFSKFL